MTKKSRVKRTREDDKINQWTKVGKSSKSLSSTRSRTQYHINSKGDIVGHVHLTLFDLTIQVEPGRNPEDTLHNQACDLMTTIWGADPIARLHPYSGEGKIYTSNDLPPVSRGKDYNSRNYLNMRDTINKSGQKMYGHFKLGNKEDPAELLENIREDLRGLGIMVFVKKVQVTERKEIC